MAAWSEGREGDGLSQEQLLLSLERIDKILEKLATDDDLREDLKHPITQKALRHWTGAERLERDEAEEVTENFRVRSLFKKITELQSACKELGLGVPLDHVMQGRKVLDNEVVLRHLGPDIMHARELSFKTRVEANHELTQPPDEQKSADNVEDNYAQPPFSWKSFLFSSLMQLVFTLLAAYIFKYVYLPTSLPSTQPDLQPETSTQQQPEDF